MKGLEALERLYCAGRLDLNYVQSPKHKQDYEIIEKELKEGEANKNASEILRIIFNAPYILETLMKRNELGKSASDRYLWGSITDEEVKKIKEFFSDGKI